MELCFYIDGKLYSAIIPDYADIKHPVQGYCQSHCILNFKNGAAACIKWHGGEYSQGPWEVSEVSEWKSSFCNTTQELTNCLAKIKRDGDARLSEKKWICSVYHRDH